MYYVISTKYLSLFIILKELATFWEFYSRKKVADYEYHRLFALKLKVEKVANLLKGLRPIKLIYSFH